MSPELQRFLNSVLPWSLRPPEDLPLTRFYLSLGLVSEEGTLNATGKWLCLEPGHPLWTAGVGGSPETRPPLRVLRTLLKDHKAFTAVELLSWLLTGPDFFLEDHTAKSLESQGLTRPHIYTQSGKQLVWFARIPRKQFDWLDGAHDTDICRVLQRVGMIRHSRFGEFLLNDSQRIIREDTEVLLQWWKA